MICLRLQKEVKTDLINQDMQQSNYSIEVEQIIFM